MATKKKHTHTKTHYIIPCVKKEKKKKKVYSEKFERYYFECKFEFDTSNILKSKFYSVACGNVNLTF